MASDDIGGLCEMLAGSDLDGPEVLIKGEAHKKGIKENPIGMVEVEMIDDNAFMFYFPRKEDRELIGMVIELPADSRECWGKFLMVRVRIDISKPLKRCLRVQLEGLDKAVVAPIHYERLPDFCFACGLIGHVIRDCADAEAKKEALARKMTREAEKGAVHNDRATADHTHEGNARVRKLLGVQRRLLEENEECLVESLLDEKREVVEGFCIDTIVLRLGNPQAFQALKRVLKRLSHNLVFLCETKLHRSEAKKYMCLLGFEGVLQVVSEGKSGGLLLFWKEWNVTVQSFSKGHMDVRVNMDNGVLWHFTSFMGVRPCLIEQFRGSF
ncbi:hypothetical protein EZV62_022304 [Acer yangbiense]|uniref:CCHC-type domain-containing protein n=1 Tax=Acer yangbiense TaxID=1000413 RepID=A0A5C7H9H1_9ROSI|nr:hypothetical protein EZV62_022304 [Acer yangbiense]